MKGQLFRRPALLLTALLGLTPLALFVAEWAGLFSLDWLRFERPTLALPAALTIEFVVLRLLNSGQRPLDRARQQWVDLATGVAVLAAALSMLGVELGRALDRLTVVVAIDRSRSIDLVPAAQSRVQKELELAELGMREGDRIALVAFGADAAVEETAHARSSEAGAQRASVARDGTDLAAAIRQSLAEVPPDSAGRIVLLTDGVATRGDTTQAALAAAAQGIPVDAVPLDQGELPDVRVVSVRVAARAAEHETISLRVVTASTRAVDVEARVYLDGELVRQGPAHLAAGEDVLYLRELAPAPGLHRFEVALSAKQPELDHIAEDNSAAAFLRVRGQSTALILQADLRRAEPMRRALASAGFRVDASDLTGLPRDLAALSRYDLLVLSDVPASDWTPEQLDALRSYVRDLGGGLALTGGDHCLGPGGYAKTPIEEISPVSFDLKQDRRRASLAEIIAVDYSSSMSASAGGKTKLDLANEAAARSAELLGAGDRLGVLHVDTSASWTVPLAPVTDASAIAARIRQVGPGGGGIFVDLALTTAYQALAHEHVQLKHVLLFADGSDAEERSRAFRLVANAQSAGITTSVVALGSGNDVAALSRMAELGGGRFYLVEDATRLPAVFAQETTLATRSAINELDFVPHPTASNPVLSGIDWTRVPELAGYVVTLPKALARVLLVGPENDPILATWSAGIGRTGAFTSDYYDRWGKNWLGWNEAPRLFAQLARDLARREDDPNVHFEAEVSGGELALNATVLDEHGRRDSLRGLHARVVGPDGTTRELPLSPAGAGSFSARAAMSRPGAYLCSLIDDASGRELAVAGAELATGSELRPTGSDRRELRRIAALTHGELRDTLAGIFGQREHERFAYETYDHWLLVVSALALLASVACRRLELPSLRRARLAAPAGASAQNAPEPASGTLGRLLSVRDQRRPPSSPLVVAAAPSARVEPLRAAAPRSADKAPSAPPPRARTAAEILLERRRARSPK